MSRFTPIHWTADEALGDGVSATFLRHLNLCPRSAFLYQRYKGQALTVEMQRGKLGHRALELATRTVIENEERDIPPDLAKAVLDEALADPEYWCPVEHHDYVREAVYRWASRTVMDPANVVAVETLFELDVAGWRVRCRIDFAELSPDGRVCVVRDYKFGPGAPPLDEIARKREDGSFVAKNMQLILYAMVLVWGVPIREETCTDCWGRGYIDLGAGDVNPPGAAEKIEVPCDDCNGRGVVEIREPFPVASRAAQFDLEFTFPAIKTADGDMQRRPLSLTRSELEPYRSSLEAMLSGLSYRKASGDWPAMVSDDACAICPAKALCPIPVEVRDHRGEINDDADCADALEVQAREKKTQAAKTKEITAYVKTHGPVRFGGDMVAEIQATSAQEIRDKDGFLAAVESAVKYGDPFDRSRFVKEKVGSRLVVRPLRADEIEGPEGSNE